MITETDALNFIRTRLKQVYGSSDLSILGIFVESEYMSSKNCRLITFKYYEQGEKKYRRFEVYISGDIFEKFYLKDFLNYSYGSTIIDSESPKDSCGLKGGEFYDKMIIFPKGRYQIYLEPKNVNCGFEMCGFQLQIFSNGQRICNGDGFPPASCDIILSYETELKIVIARDYGYDLEEHYTVHVKCH